MHAVAIRPERAPPLSLTLDADGRGLLGGKPDSSSWIQNLSVSDQAAIRGATSLATAGPRCNSVDPTGWSTRRSVDNPIFIKNRVIDDAALLGREHDVDVPVTSLKSGRVAEVAGALANVAADRPGAVLI